MICVALFEACNWGDPPGTTHIDEDAAARLLPAAACYDFIETDCLCQVDPAVAALTPDACESAIAGWVATAKAQKLTYSASCMRSTYDKYVEFHDDNPDFCEESDADFRTWLRCQDECQIYHGESPEGAACERVGRYMSSCAEGLVCGADGVCHQPCDAPPTIPAGGACGYIEGFLAEECVGGFVCDPETNRCVAELPIGDSCDADSPRCTANAWCPPATPEMPTEACTPRAGLGESCTSHEQCTSGVCAAVCRAPDPLGCRQPYF